MIQKTAIARKTCHVAICAAFLAWGGMSIAAETQPGEYRPNDFLGLDLPTAVLFQEHNDLTRSILAALQNTRYFKVTEFPQSEAELDTIRCPVLAVPPPPVQGRSRFTDQNANRAKWCAST